MTKMPQEVCRNRSHESIASDGRKARITAAASQRCTGERGLAVKAARTPASGAKPKPTRPRRLTYQSRQSSSGSLKEGEPEAGTADTGSHRGPDPEDAELFGPGRWPGLRAATTDLCWLLDRGYAIASSVELVGNRYSLARRQRIAVRRCACSSAAAEGRRLRQVGVEQVRGQSIWLDGFNVLTGLEVALAGGVVLQGRDGCCRDVAGVHARYRTVAETIPALKLVGELTREWGVSSCRWWLDQPISNSGRLRAMILTVAADCGWAWEADMVFNPDKVLIDATQTVATSDSVILDRCRQWINLLRLIIECRIPQTRIVDFGSEPPIHSGAR